MHLAFCVGKLSSLWHFRGQVANVVQLCVPFMKAFSTVIIIFNPNSTGNSPALAKSFARDLKEHLPKINVNLKQTEHTGHAEEIAYQVLLKDPNALVVSSSGDGGYNEVVNGAMRAAKETGIEPLCAVLPGGNANDHQRRVYSRPLLDALRDGKVRRLDLLCVEWGDTSRYAHSYVGLGLSSHAAHEVNRQHASRIRQTLAALFAMWHFTPALIHYGGKRRTYDSLVVANIDMMAKYLHLAKGSQPDDGVCEVITVRHRGKWQLLRAIIRSMMRRAPEIHRRKGITFTTLRPLSMQLDGEIQHLSADERVTVRVKHRVLRTLA